jgi:quercetin dioxygenase-like cupin family protein
LKWQIFFNLSFDSVSFTLINAALNSGKPIMSLINLKLAVAQSEAWTSSVLAKVGGANVKVMRMDGAPYPDESHDYPEGLLVTDGQLNLIIGSNPITVRAGEIFIVPVGVAHAVAPGSIGTLVIFDA